MAGGPARRLVMRGISALAPVVALCVSYILGTALAAALGLEPATVGAPVAVILFEYGLVVLLYRRIAAAHDTSTCPVITCST